MKFTTVSSAAGSLPQPPNIYAIDVNNDGIPDLIQSATSNGAGFTVSIAKGNGSFDAPVTYAFPEGPNAPPGLAFADFNGDGKVDIAAPVTGSNGNEIAVYLGNGNGTFQAPKISKVDLPSGYAFNDEPSVAADFNHDGKIDLAVIAPYQGAGGVAAILAGDGKGDLTLKDDIFTFPAATYSQQMVTGDFDADNNADIALTTMNEYGTDATVHVLYGNGAFGFEDTTAYSTSGSFTLSSGDLNSDGRTDLFGYEQTSTAKLVLLYGETDRIFATYYDSNVPVSSEGTDLGSLAMADFNGDGRMDLVAINSPSGSHSELMFFLAGASPGEFTTQLYTMPFYESSYVVVGDFNGDKKPDVAAVQTSNGLGGTIETALNETSGGYYGGCAYPKIGEGISLCTPTGSSAANPVSVQAMANSFGQIRKFELYVDGKKITEQHHTWGHNAYFDLSQTFSAGYHSATLDFTTIDNDAVQHGFNFTVK